jgi:uncharacterized protein (DUF488 family)
MPFKTICTVGHGNRSLESFIDLLDTADIEALVDVRAYPRSRRHPHFSQAPLQAALADAGIVYRWMGEQLGGRRAPKVASPHIALAEGIRAFGDHMQTTGFKLAASELEILARQSTTAIMCAEKLPQHCHRALIADFLVSAGAEIVHIIDFDHRLEHRLSLAARKVAGDLIYDLATTRELNL